MQKQQKEQRKRNAAKGDTRSNKDPSAHSSCFPVKIGADCSSSSSSGSSGSCLLIQTFLACTRETEDNTAKANNSVLTHDIHAAATAAAAVAAAVAIVAAAAVVAAATAAANEATQVAAAAAAQVYRHLAFLFAAGQEIGLRCLCLSSASFMHACNQQMHCKYNSTCLALSPSASLWLICLL